MILWREKFKATGLHFLVTLTLAACAAAIIFLVWFPDPMQTMIGGTELFVLVTGCDVALGPLSSLVVYNSRKTRRALVFDYVVIGSIQLAALCYGVYILAGTRPVYVAFSADRLEVVVARDVTDAELAAAKDPRYASLPFTGPRLVGIKVPEAERNDATFQSLAGNEEHMRPRFYVPYEELLPDIRTHAKSIAELEKLHPLSKPLLDAASSKLQIPASRVGWLPVHHFKGFWTALIDTENGKPLTYVDFDPY
jgi:hypothetical protein